MSLTIFSRIYKFITNSDIDAFAFNIKSDMNIIKTLYIPSFDLYITYCNIYKQFKIYKLNETFDEGKSEYTNVKKIKLKSHFCFDLEEQYEKEEDTRQNAIQIALQHKDIFDNI